MRKIIMAVVVCLLTTYTSVNAANDKPIEFDQLPDISQQIIREHFTNHSVALVKMEDDLFTKSYEVIFTNGDKVEFNKKGSWEEVDCKYTELPIAIVPVAIVDYVAKKFPNVKLLQIEKEFRNRYEVELSSGISLTFDSKFNVIDIDD